VTCIAYKQPMYSIYKSISEHMVEDTSLNISSKFLLLRFFDSLKQIWLQVILNIFPMRIVILYENMIIYPLVHFNYPMNSVVCTTMINNIESKRKKVRENRDTDLYGSTMCLR
jgi:hypothetical protein